MSSSKIARPSQRRRGGYSIVIVLGLLAVGMSLSYAALHTQGSNLRLQRNSELRSTAMEAAHTGLSMAYRQMSQNSWAGVDSVLNRSLSGTSGYSVSFDTGDSHLTAGSPDYARWPYRVTITSTGYAQDPQVPQSIALYKAQSVVELVPRALSPSPADWQRFQQYTVFQHRDRNFAVHFPGRITGRVWVQGRVYVSEEYPDKSDVRNLYLEHLNYMRFGGYPDMRPLEGPVHLDQGKQSSTGLSRLGMLGVSQVSIVNPVNGWQRPAETEEYRLYPGGKAYEVPRVAQTLQNVVLEPDPKTNPLGLFYRSSGIVYLQDNVVVRGTLLAADVHLSGRNVRVQPPDVRPVMGEARPIKLPAIVVHNDVRFYPSASATIEGAVSVEDKFDVRDGNNNASLMLRGRLITGEFYLGGRTSWDVAQSTWSLYKLLFDLQSGTSIIPYFPAFAYIFGFDPQPQIQFMPPADEVIYHWPSVDTPLYVPHGNDGGLRWDVIRWGERVE